MMPQQQVLCRASVILTMIMRLSGAATTTAKPKHLIITVIDDLGACRPSILAGHPARAVSSLLLRPPNQLHRTTTSARICSPCLLPQFYPTGFDDFGYTNGNQIKTPTFDSMRADGVGFTQYYVQPSCSPTRATILTGRKPVHTGINFWIPNAAYGLPLNETTFAQVMNARGYKSHAVGKVCTGCPRPQMLHPADVLPCCTCALTRATAVASRTAQERISADFSGL